jgi:hypothetical protein
LAFASSGIVGGQSTSAEADFTINNNGTLTLVLANTYTGSFISAVQLIGGLTFDVSGANGSGALTTVNSGQVGTISTSGLSSSLTTDTLTRWQASESGNTVNITALSGGNPDRLIIGSSGIYSSVNSSITGDNPAVWGFATFIISIPGLTANSTISNVIFGFGTSTDHLSGTPTTPHITSVPEPSTVVAGALLLLPLGVAGLRSLRRRDQAV